ncbi:MAG TPA: threonine ammonia-lyase, biosynthetic [Polyangiaceae bacterium]
MQEDYLRRILNARVYDVAIESPLELAPNLSARLGNSVWLKREDLQPVFSFKLRGAYNKMSQLSASLLERGVVSASAGNHAQGVAFAATRLGTKAIIVMPETTPSIKVSAVRARGATAVLAGASFDDAYAAARRIEQEEGLTFIHPFDDVDVIAGQGTIGMEILRQHEKPIEAIFCAVGGGGLISGVAAYTKMVRPEIRIVGVEAQDAATMTESLARGERVTLAQVGTFADGAAVKCVGAEPFRLAQCYVDDMICVDNDAICAAIKDVFEDTRSILEPAGALSIAGLKSYATQHACEGHALVAVASGANVNFDRLRFIAERAELGEQREALLAVTIPERPGSFLAFCERIGRRHVTEFNYRYADAERAHVFVGVEVKGRSESRQLVQQLQNDGFETLELTDDELSKLHLRHLVGGHAAGAMHERLLRFVFPEHPGALLSFLKAMRSGWNISLFHYRNHGADFGRVLVGLQVPPGEESEFDAFLTGLGYDCQEESENPAYRMFLG